MQLPSPMLILVAELVQSTWTMLVAVVVRVTSLIAHVPLLSVVTDILMMLESDVKVKL